MNENTSNTYHISFSQKVSLLSFVLCCGVISQHVQWTCNDYEWLNTLQKFWFFIIETCVPFFFIISGYLFFRTYVPNKWKDKLMSRAKTLLIPYLIWNACYAITMISLYKVGVVKNIQNVDTLLGGVILCLNSNYGVLWFVKYLMVFVCISPLMYFLLRNKLSGALMLLTLLFINAYNYYNDIIPIPLNVNSNHWSMLIYQYIFFAIGSYAALCWKKHVENPNLLKSLLGIILLIVLIIFYWKYISRGNDVFVSFAIVYSLARK